MAEKTVAELLDETLLLSKDDLCRLCQVDAAWVDDFVSHGAMGDAVQGTAFSVRSITVVRKARRLEQDFALNMPGIALAMDLLDEIDRLRRALDRTS